MRRGDGEREFRDREREREAERGLIERRGDRECVELTLLGDLVRERSRDGLRERERDRDIDREGERDREGMASNCLRSKMFIDQRYAQSIIKGLCCCSGSVE